MLSARQAHYPGSYPCMRQVIILRKDVDYTLHGMTDEDGMDLD